MKTTIKYLLIAVIIAASRNYTFAEKKSGVSGQVKDAETKKNMEFCTVRVFDAKDSLLTGAVTDQTGFFYLPLKRGKYKLVTNFIGYKSDTTDITVITGNEFIGIIKLYPEENTVDEVIINGKTSDNLIDKDEYLVTTEMRTGSADTKDVLDKIEGVTYDRYNNSIKVDGEENIMILVNGLQKDPEYILTLNPERLKKIEVVRDPSGRYALEGYSAIINVILKDDYKGFEFSLEENMLIDTDDKNGHIFPMNRVSATFNYTYNKLNVYTKIRNAFMDFFVNSSAKKEYYDNNFLSEKNPPDENPNANTNRNFDKITAGADYFINPKNTLSYETGFSGLLFPETDQTSNYLVKYYNNNTETESFYSEYKNISSDKSNYHTLFYKSILNEKNTLNADFTFSSSENKYKTDYFENQVLVSSQEGINDNLYTKFNIELEKSFNKKSNFTSGYGNTRKKVTNTYNFGETEFTRYDLRHKLYLYYSYRINPKLGFKLGIAGETSTPEIENKKLTYFIYQPYADIKIKPHKILDIRLKYRSSSDYPSITQANPDTLVIDENTVSTGNPYIEPSVTHKLSVRFNIMGQLASFEPYYRFSNNYISKTGQLDENGTFVYSYDNTGKYKKYGFKVGLTVPLGKSIFWQNNADFFTSSITYNNEENSINDWTMSSNLMYMNKKHKTVAGIIYQNNLKKVITAQGYNMWNNDFWGLMIQQPLLKQKLNVMIFYIMPIDVGADYVQGSFIKTDTYEETNLQDIEILKNMLMFRISFRLNKGKSVRKTDKNIEFEDEKQEKGGII